MALQDKIDERRKEIRTDGYPISIGEWVSLYENKELDIHPEFQRFFRWSDAQKTALIESILLGIPIPSIFVSQRPNGVWDVVDGLQRLSTIFQFMGILRNENGDIIKPLILDATKYLPQLSGVAWDANGAVQLPPESKLIIKRSKINASIILRESDESAKYDLFQRLNTGGSQASDQEVRNCIMVMIRPEFFRWIKNLAEDQNFSDAIALSDRPIQESYDLELTLRFLIFSFMDDADLNSVGDVGLFLSERMRELIDKPQDQLEPLGKAFRETFRLLNDTMSDTPFKRYNKEKDRFMGGFLISQFEVVACGIGWNLAAGNSPTDISNKVAALWSNKDYTDWQGSGITAARRLPRLIPLGRNLFEA
ncbi:DUF262 domain-containing protein [Sphingobium sp. BS19]|uniref:DUF262 domain-containing protein n=1 Tax=Sphingobium sp. BS19 TaxID=3018973 RepID=UPI0022EE57B2|nr:DUF262 domain-containing protein [Sphingobium sp. BS19]GLJ00474.1 hypothetical protein Sbs19_42920 [Sphingobium sp. BS19]